MSNIWLCVWTKPLNLWSNLETFGTILNALIKKMAELLKKFGSLNGPTKFLRFKPRWDQDQKPNVEKVCPFQKQFWDHETIRTPNRVQVSTIWYKPSPLKMRAHMLRSPTQEAQKT